MDEYQNVQDAATMALYRDWEDIRKIVHIEIVAVPNVN